MKDETELNKSVQNLESLTTNEESLNLHPDTEQQVQISVYNNIMMNIGDKMTEDEILDFIIPFRCLYKNMAH